MFSVDQIRKLFLDFFASKGHRIIKSDSLVPKDDPTVLFTTAGMQQFKPQFMGHLTGFSRAATSQKCLRTDDLTEVGVTDFHHTMFEMLGNFSFGDYFKREAITWAWEFLTKVMGLPADKLWVSVNKDDDEAYGIWLNEIKVPAERIVKLGDKSNFWPSNARLNGPNGPCGPCSEIFFDWGKNDCKNPDCNPDCSCGRFCEIWNLVFTQYNRKDGGVLEPLPAKNIDTGMGLERLTAVIQGKHNNFDSDLFQPIMAAVEKAVTAEGAKISLREQRVITDHIRAVTFGIADGVVPSNEGRGYVMRRLIVDMTNILIQAGIKKPLVHTFVTAVVGVMKGPYPELVGKEKDVTAMIKRVEEAVIKLNVEKGPEFITVISDPALRELLTNNPAQGYQALGEKIFFYRDTHGLPESFIKSQVEVVYGSATTACSVNIAKIFFAEQKERSRTASKMQGDVFLSGDVDVKGLPKTIFLGYDKLSADVTIKAIFVNGQKAEEAKDGDNVAVILDQTPFYAEQGGQAADIGSLKGKTGIVDIKDTQKQNDVFIHKGVVTGSLKVGEMVTASVRLDRRLAIMRNHTATHLLQAALRAILGAHVQQQGSLVDDERLRFDFSHPKALTRDEIRRIEDDVNAHILNCDPVSKETMTMDKAKEKGALAFFAEKYGETVRLVSVGDYSKELCGGTHLNSTGQIGLFKIVNECAIAQGIRRIEAKTGIGAVALVNRYEDMLREIGQAFKSPVEEVHERINSQGSRLKALEKELERYRFDALKGRIDEIIAKAPETGGAKIIVEKFTDIDINLLRKAADLIRQKVSSAVVILAAVSSDNSHILMAVTEDLVKKGIKADEIIREMATRIDGSGGGRPQMAQAGSKNSAGIDAALSYAKNLLASRLNA